MPYKDELRKLIVKNNRRLQVLKEKKAVMGLNTPPEVVIEIEDLEAEITRLEDELASEPVNEELGSYRLATIRGRGGMAEVYRAYDSKLARFVAVKVLHRHLSEDDAFVDRFYNEATTVANLKHPNIVQVYDFGQDRGKYYMVMELIDGDTLETKLTHHRANNHPFTLTETIHILEPLAAAIDYAHTKGVVHHDLKPSNIMFEGQRVVLTDFGIARLVEMTGQTASWARLGTPAYMAPEQVQGERGDTRSDIYALGVILYEMLTGNESTPLLISDVNLPPGGKAVILKALSKNPDNRYQTAGEILDDLRQKITAPKQPASTKTPHITSSSSPSPSPSEFKSANSGEENMLPEPKIYKLEQTVSLFNQGRASFQRALKANQSGDFSAAETALISAARDLADSLEWALKIYLNNIPKLSADDRRKLRHPNFHVLITLMKKYGDPPLTEKQGQQMYGYRDMRNEATHAGAIPPVEEVKKAVEGARQFLHRYFNVEDQRPNISPESIESEPEPKLPPPSLSPSQIRRLKREKQNLERQLEMLSNKIDALRQNLTLETRVEERMRLQAVIETEEELQAEFEEKLDDIERQLAGQGSKPHRSKVMNTTEEETISGNPEQKTSSNPSEPKPAGEIKANFGNVSGQVAIGTGNVVIQTSSNAAHSVVTEADQVILQKMLTSLRSQVNALVPLEKREALMERIGELEEAITTQKPDLDTIGYVKNWFIKNMPVLAEEVNKIIVHPTTGKMIAAADQALGIEFKRRFS